MARNILPAVLNNLADDDNNLNNIMPAILELVVPLNGPHLARLFDHRGDRRPHNLSYYEETIPLYNVNEFKTHFRMSRRTIQVLCEDIGRRLPNGHVVVPLEKKVLFAVWMLAKPDTFLAAGDRFNFSKSTAHRIFYEIVNAVADGIDEYIRWPTPIQQQQSSEVFRMRSGGFNGIVGVIDGSHIGIKKPQGNEHDYYNRKQFHSVLLQGVCDDKCRFINVTTGYPGRLHDARVYRLSPLGQELQGNHEMLINNPQHHLIGDAAFGLRPYLLTPYRDTGHLTPREINYNRKLSAVRSTIERCFGRLKGKFRRLKLLELTNLNLISKTILASCALHNIVIDNDGISDDEYSDEEDDLQQPEEVGQVHRNEDGEQKRAHITATLP